MTDDTTDASPTTDDETDDPPADAQSNDATGDPATDTSTVEITDDAADGDPPADAPADEASAGEPADGTADDGSSRVGEYLLKGALVMLVVLGMIATLQFYLHAQTAIGRLVALDYRPLFLAGFNLVVLLAVGIGIAQAVRRLG